MCEAYAQQEKTGHKDLPPSEQSMVALFPTEWLDCHTQDDCNLVPYNCSEAVAVNKIHSKEANDVICKQKGVFCSWLQCQPPRRYAECENNKCLIKSGVDPIYACHQSSDCKLIKYDCTAAIAVNTKYAQQITDRICATHDCDTTNCTNAKSIDYTTTCVASSCGAGFTPAAMNDDERKQMKILLEKTLQRGQ